MDEGDYRSAIQLIFFFENKCGIYFGHACVLKSLTQIYPIFLLTAHSFLMARGRTKYHREQQRERACSKLHNLVYCKNQVVSMLKLLRPMFVHYSAWILGTRFLHSLAQLQNTLNHTACKVLVVKLETFLRLWIVL